MGTPSTEGKAGRDRLADEYAACEELVEREIDACMDDADIAALFGHEANEHPDAEQFLLLSAVGCVLRYMGTGHIRHLDDAVGHMRDANAVSGGAIGDKDGAYLSTPWQSARARCVDSVRRLASSGWTELERGEERLVAEALGELLAYEEGGHAYHAGAAFGILRALSSIRAPL